MRYEAEYSAAMEAAQRAGAFLRDAGEAEVSSQEGRDIKLSADRQSERMLLDMLETTHVPVLSEEMGFVGRKGGARMWVIDPLDGTANYWRGLRELSCVSVALFEAGQPVLGVVNRFACGEIFSGVTGQGAWLNHAPIHTSSVGRTTEAVLATGLPLKRAYDAGSLSSFVRQAQCFKKVRMLGAAALMGAFVAAGRVDAYMEEHIMLWDVAAAAAIAKAAGGVVFLEHLEERQCICRCFANASLRESWEQMEREPRSC